MSTKSPTTTTTYGTLPTSTIAGGDYPSATTSSSSPLATYNTDEDQTFLNRFARQTRTLIHTRRPWREFFFITPISLPHGYADATTRLRRNLGYFRFNYSLVVLFILFVSLLWHPISMIVFLAIFILWLYLYFSRDEPVSVFNRNIDDRIVLLGLSIVTILALVFTHVGLNVLIALVIGVSVVCIHGVFRGCEDMFLDEGEIGEDAFAGGRPLRPTHGRTSAI